MSFEMNRASREAWTKFIMERPFTMYVTWKFPKLDALEDQISFESRSACDLERYLMFVSGRVFGRKAHYDNAKALRHLTFFERESKHGGSTVLHAHSLIEADTKNYNRVEHYLRHKWEKFKPHRLSADPFIEKIEGIHRLAWYHSKFTHHDTHLLSNLP